MRLGQRSERRCGRRGVHRAERGWQESREFARRLRGSEDEQAGDGDAIASTRQQGPCRARRQRLRLLRCPAQLLLEPADLGVHLDGDDDPGTREHKIDDAACRSPHRDLDRRSPARPAQLDERVHDPRLEVVPDAWTGAGTEPDRDTCAEDVRDHDEDREGRLDPTMLDSRQVRLWDAGRCREPTLTQPCVGPQVGDLSGDRSAELGRPSTDGCPVAAPREPIRSGVHRGGSNHQGLRWQSTEVM